MLKKPERSFPSSCLEPSCQGPAAHVKALRQCLQIRHTPEIGQEQRLCAKNKIVPMPDLVLQVGIWQLRRSVHIDEHDPRQCQHRMRTQELGHDFETEIETG